MVNPSKAIPKTLFPSFPAWMIFAHQPLLSTSFTQDHPLPRTPPPRLPHALWSLQAPPVSLTTSSSTPTSSDIFICYENNKDFGIILTLVQGTHSYLHYFFGEGGTVPGSSLLCGLPLVAVSRGYSLIVVRDSLVAEHRL